MSSSDNYFFCLKCHRVFISNSDDKKPPCPYCGSDDTRAWFKMREIIPALPIFPTAGDYYDICLHQLTRLRKKIIPAQYKIVTK